MSVVSVFVPCVNVCMYLFMFVYVFFYSHSHFPSLSFLLYFVQCLVVQQSTRMYPLRYYNSKPTKIYTTHAYLCVASKRHQVTVVCNKLDMMSEWANNSEWRREKWAHTGVKRYNNYVLVNKLYININKVTITQKTSIEYCRKKRRNAHCESEEVEGSNRREKSSNIPVEAHISSIVLDFFCIIIIPPNNIFWCDIKAYAYT